MNADTHYLIVADATRYIRDHGTNFQRNSLEALLKACMAHIAPSERPLFFDHMEQNDLWPYFNSVAWVLGWESVWTDEYHDVRFRDDTVLDNFKNTHKNGLVFTAINHFINTVWDAPPRWWGAVRGYNGYHYFLSSKQDKDAEAMTGLVDTAGIEVDETGSLLFPRLEHYFRNPDNWTWDKNFDSELRFTVFPPLTVLAHDYYSKLIHNFYASMVVNGPVLEWEEIYGPFGGEEPMIREPKKYRTTITGLQYLGPVLHFVADACVPQHVRAALGLNHQFLENIIEALHKNGEIMDVNLVEELLTKKPFNPWYCYQGSSLDSYAAIDWIIAQIAYLTRNRLAAGMGKSGVDLFNASVTDWFAYALRACSNGDLLFYYNLAVAGTVHIFSRAYDDLVREGILSPNPGLVHPERLPNIQLVELKSKDIQRLLIPPQEPPLPTMSTAIDLLGYAPVAENSQLQRYLEEFNDCFHEETIETINSEKVSSVLRMIEEALVTEHGQMRHRRDPKFSPIKALNNNPARYKVSTEFGSATYRLPTRKELQNPDLLAAYGKNLHIHEYRVHLLGQVRLLAAVEWLTRELNETSPIYHKVQRLSGEIRELLDRMISIKGIPAVPEPLPSHLDSESFEEVKDPEELIGLGTIPPKQ